MGSDIGYFSVLRWRRDATRDEARNVAVVLVEPEGQFGALKAAPLSGISPRLKEQGLLDAMIVGLTKRLTGDLGVRPNLADLREMHERSARSLYFTEPRAIAVSDVDLAIGALYRALVQPRNSGPSYPTKGKVLDVVVDRIRARLGPNLIGDVRRGEYRNDFLFDVVIDHAQPQFAEVLSFATPNKKWADTEYEVGHFLYALERTDGNGFVVIQAPTDVSQPTAVQSYDRVRRWLDDANVLVFGPTDIDRVPLVGNGVGQ